MELNSTSHQGQQESLEKFCDLIKKTGNLIVNVNYAKIILGM